MTDSSFPIHHSPFSQDDLLWRQLKTIPAFRALLRAVEARFYRQIELPGPILDLGCGDGHFAQMTFDQPLDAGADPWPGPLKKAQKSGMYQHLALSMGDSLPFPDNYFASAFSNSVLEHIPDVQAVLNETNRVMKPGGQLVVTMPSHLFTAYLGGAGFFEKLGADGLAERYRRFFNYISRHAHTDSPEVWADRFAQAGFVVERWQYYFSREALRALEWGHVQGLPSAILHALTGHWILGPWEENLQRTERWVRPFYDEPFGSEGAYLFFILRKAANGPVNANLPAARPFVQMKMETENGQQLTENRQQPTIREREPAANLQPPARSNQQPKLNPRWISGGLVLLSLFAAAVGQSILNAQPPDPMGGVRWYVYSLIPLLILAWRSQSDRMKMPRLTWPQRGQIPRHRWFYGLSLFFVLLAPRVVNNPTSQPQPGLAIALWLAAIGLAAYALQPHHASYFRQHVSGFTFHASRFTLIASAALFLAAFLARTLNLSSLPFILNGAEASIGLDVMSVRDGLSQNPFTVGWLTNPTLPYFVMAWPMRWLGASALSVRAFSPLVGSVTVVAVYWLGRRIWGQTVGLIAAVLLTGANLHLHYSRMGMTNIWDPLLTLLALGLLTLAWERKENGRLPWLMAGLAIGFNAYVFTASHLLPLMLAALVIFALLFDREAIQRHWRHILAAAALAFIVALPQLTYYRQNPGVFMQRANALGILEGQTNWLADEAERAGVSATDLMREQFRQALLSFNYSLDKSGSYRPERPLLNWGMSILFVIGLAFAAVRGWKMRYSILLVWVIVPIIFGGALLLESPSSHRLVIAAPALALLAAIGLTEIGQMAVVGQKSKGNDRKTAAAAPAFLPILLSVAMLLALLDIGFYFGTYRQQHSFADRNTEIANGVADYLNTLDGETWTAHFFGPPQMYISFPTIPFLAADFQANVNLFDVETMEEAWTPTGVPNRAFIFLPEQADKIERIMGLYPDGRLQTFSGFHADPLFFAYEISQ